MPELTSFQYLLLAAVGIVAGFINVLAGGGSALTMPLLMFFGYPAAIANGTNRIAVVAQNAASVTEFWRKGRSNFRQSAAFGLCALPGAIAGAMFAVQLDDALFRKALAGVIVLILWQTLKKGTPRPEAEHIKQRHWLGYLGMVFAGFWGGFIQAGVGFVIIGILRFSHGYDLVTINMHKVFIVGMYLIPSLLVFTLTSGVDWGTGIVLALGNGLGAWFGTRAALAKGDKLIRLVFAVAATLIAIKLIVT